MKKAKSKTSVIPSVDTICFVSPKIKYNGLRLGDRDGQDFDSYLSIQSKESTWRIWSEEVKRELTPDALSRVWQELKHQMNVRKRRMVLTLNVTDNLVTFSRLNFQSVFHLCYSQEFSQNNPNFTAAF